MKDGARYYKKTILNPHNNNVPEERHWCANYNTKNKQGKWMLLRKDWNTTYYSWRYGDKSESSVIVDNYETNITIFSKPVTNKFDSSLSTIACASYPCTTVNLKPIRVRSSLQRDRTDRLSKTVRFSLSAELSGREQPTHIRYWNQYVNNCPVGALDSGASGHFVNTKYDGGKEQKEA